MIASITEWLHQGISSWNSIEHDFVSWKNRMKNEPPAKVTVSYHGSKPGCCERRNHARMKTVALRQMEGYSVDFTCRIRSFAPNHTMATDNDEQVNAP